MQRVSDAECHSSDAFQCRNKLQNTINIRRPVKGRERIPPSCCPWIRPSDLSDIAGLVIRHALSLITDIIPFVSPSLDWLGLASLASAWLVSSAAATTTATTPEQASTTIAAALRRLLPTNRATLRQGEPRQARQADQGRDSQMALDIFLMRPRSGNPLTTCCGSGISKL